MKNTVPLPGGVARGFGASCLSVYTASLDSMVINARQSIDVPMFLQYNNSREPLQPQWSRFGRTPRGCPLWIGRLEEGDLCPKTDIVGGAFPKRPKG